MSVALELEPRHANGTVGARLLVDTAQGELIKEERRTVVWRQRLPDGTPSVIKLYRHRKPSWLQRHGWERGRAQREFEALDYLDRQGLACSAPLFWAHGTTPKTGLYDLLATREVPGALDLNMCLKQPEGAKRLDLAPLFALVAAMHRLGLQHGALQDRNVLLAGDAYYLIDLPRSHRFHHSIEGRKCGLFDVRLLLQSLARYLPDQQLADGLAGYARLPMSPQRLIRAIREKPMNNRRLNTLHAVFTVFSGLNRLIHA